MIRKNNKLILQIHKEILDIVDSVEQQTQKKIGAIYKGSKLIWLTIYDAIKSCFGSGTWFGDKSWLGDDSWE